MRIRGKLIFFLLLLGLFAVPAAASQDELQQTRDEQSTSASSTAEPATPPQRDRRDTHDFEASLVRSAIIALALGVFAVGVNDHRF